jgi:NADPH:quinone reductase-like Zn-dependent oxidoreductase
MNPRTMTAWTTAGDGIDGLAATTVPVPSPGPSEILVRITAWSLSYRDLLVINGVEGWRPPGPVIPVSDAVGTVVARGEGVSRYQVGDRVSAAFLPRWRSGPLTAAVYTRPTGGPLNRGMLADWVTIDENEAVLAPTSLTDPEAATLPVAAITAWHAVVVRNRVAAGQSVLIHGTGGVALFALQFCLALGAQPIVTSSSDEKLTRLHELGAVRTVNYRRSPDVVGAVLDLTDGTGVDHVIETIGGENLNISLAAVRIGGTVAFIGLLAGLAAHINTYEFVTKNVTLHGIETGSQDMYAQMAAFIDAHRLKPVVDSSYPVSSVRGALHHLDAGRHLGKIILIPDDTSDQPGAEGECTPY